MELLDEYITNKANIRGKVKEVIHFSTDEKKNYAIIINKVARLYAIRLINYEQGDEVKIIAVKRFPDLVGFYQTKEEAYNHARIIKEEQKVDQCKYEFETQEDDIENILIIGRTGGGKSTLANVISDVDEFSASEFAISKTKNFQIKVFEWNGIKYRVVDTIGVADTKLPPNKVVFKLAEAIHSMKGGIKQVFAVVVKTRFENFKNFEKVEEDKKALEKENKKLIRSVKGIIHVDNPSSDDERRRTIDEETRKDSRRRLLEYLETCQGSYKMEYWDTICVRINDFMNAREKWGKDRNKDMQLTGEAEKRQLGQLMRDSIFILFLTTLKTLISNPSPLEKEVMELLEYFITGFCKVEDLNEMIKLDTINLNLTEFPPGLLAPIGVQGYRAILLNNASILYIGGQPGGDVQTLPYSSFDKLSMYNINNGTWSLVATSGDIPPSRYDHAQYNQILILYGFPISLNPMMALDTVKFEWTIPTVKNVGGPNIGLRRFTSILIETYVFIAFGSYNSSGRNSTNNFFLLDVSQKNIYEWVTSYDSTKQFQLVPTTTSSTASNSSPFNNVGAIIGIAFGAIAGIIILSTAAIFIIRRYGCPLYYSAPKQGSIDEPNNEICA
ncbi:25174_t:CDS:2 [Gigaspora margarita]|uniref:25174_t:CDS:1 n=1 Tax=Gigaspora margarita TaxID=4874 RepID=A0ABM8W4I4_GIGMA|nr:25174_t:CDS:2 [Gigaspora margarita]